MIKANRKTFKVSDLVPASYNPRKIDKKQRSGLKKSLEKFGYLQDVIVNVRDNKNIIVGGHRRLEGLGLELSEEIECTIVDLGELQEKALNVALNNRHISGDYETEGLEKILAELKDGLEDFDELNFDDLAVEFDFNFEVEPPGEADNIPDIPEAPVIKLGDLIELGEHRLLCGDSTDKVQVERLMNGKKAVLLHADPPYGMGKEKDGVENDNLYREKLDAFQIDWWKTYRPFLEDNASVYIWGNAEDLWRMWFLKLSLLERFTLRNEIIWNKEHGQGENSSQHRMFPTATERCLFFMIGEQGFNNNADNYWEGWEPIRKYLFDQRMKMGWNIPEMKRIVGHSDLSRDHWTSRSQWLFVTRDVYNKMREAAQGDAFKKDYDELKKDYDELKQEFYSTRAYFNNTHENMTDVWGFQRVIGDERHGHATPKPVAMMERIIKSSCPKGGIVIEPFCGSGSTLIGAEKINRRCFTMDMTPKYIQMTIQRWCDYTDKTEIKINGESVDWNQYKA